jgi:antirestriction protein ArdC
MRDIYQAITDQIVSALENGVRPWHQPWSATHMEGRVALPLRHNGVAYRGVNVLASWMQAMAKGCAAPIWMTFRQALALGANVRKGEKGSLVVYADKITRTETDSETNEESVCDIHYMKGYTVFNAEQINGLSISLCQGRAAHADHSAHQAGRNLLLRDRRNCAAWRQSCLLQHWHRPCADAAHRKFARCRGVLRDAWS